MKLLWLDLETSGLDPHKCEILEVYAAIADLSNPFEIEKEIGSFVIGQAIDIGMAGVWPLASEAPKWDPFVREMHTKNGLIEDMARSAYTRRDAENEILPHVPEVDDIDERTTLTGSTIAFDLGFLRVHMPTLAKRLHYRTFDISSIKLLARAFGREKWPKAEAHRARADVLESIRHGREASNYIASQNSIWPSADPFASLADRSKYLGGDWRAAAFEPGIVDVSKTGGAR